jgi:hypothetical protein
VSWSDLGDSLETALASYSLLAFFYLLTLKVSQEGYLLGNVFRNITDDVVDENRGCSGRASCQATKPLQCSTGNPTKQQKP